MEYILKQVEKVSAKFWAGFVGYIMASKKTDKDSPDLVMTIALILVMAGSIALLLIVVFGPTGLLSR